MFFIDFTWRNRYTIGRKLDIDEGAVWSLLLAGGYLQTIKIEEYREDDAMILEFKVQDKEDEKGYESTDLHFAEIKC